MSQAEGFGPWRFRIERDQGGGLSLDLVFEIAVEVILKTPSGSIGGAELDSRRLLG